LKKTDEIDLLDDYKRIRGRLALGKIPNTDSTIRISKMMNRTRTIIATGDGNGNMLINHQMSPKTTRYTIRLIIKSIHPPLLVYKLTLN